MMVWWCRCPQLVIDDAGKPWHCQAVARVVATFDLPSNSGPVLHARTLCDAGHPVTVLYEQLVLLG